MKDMNVGDKPPWREFARLQQFVERGSHHGRVELLAVEEAIGAVAEEVADHTPGSLKRRFRSLLLNRSSKYRQREAIDKEIASAVRAEIGGQPEADPSEANVVGAPGVDRGEPRGQRALARFARLFALRATNETEDPALTWGRREEIALIRAALAAEDWALLWEKFALDRSYEDLAAARGVPVGTLKARVARLRMRLRAGRATMTVAV